MGEHKSSNIRVFRQKKSVNIGLILFGIVFIYLIFALLSYVTQKKISVYEVREGSILKDTAYTGYIQREESIIAAEKDGFINYFVAAGSKVGGQTNVYTITEDKLDLDSVEITSDDTETASSDDTPSDESTITEDGEVSEESSSVEKDVTTSSELSSIDQELLLQAAQTFSDSYNPLEFNDVYSFKNSISSIISDNSVESRQAKLNSLVNNNTEGLSVYTGSDDGIIEFYTDGYEGLTKDDITLDIINNNNSERTEFSNNVRIKQGDPAYKLITSETWSVIISIDKDAAKELQDYSTIKVEFLKDNHMLRADLELKKTKEGYLAYLTFKTSLIRYAEERYVDIQLILEDQSGLKIPKSAVLESEFYTVPYDYITKGGNSNSTGVLKVGRSNSVKFQEAEIYYHDLETDMVYLNKSDIKKGTVIQLPDSNETYTVENTAKLKGVYNINKGYAVFRQIDILCESDEYYIISTGSSYGLANYDHIALDCKGIKEKDVIY